MCDAVIFFFMFVAAQGTLMQSFLFVRFDVLTAVLTDSYFVGCDAVTGISSSHAPYSELRSSKP